MLDVIETLRALARRHRDLRTLAALDDRALADLGISRDQALHLAAIPDAVSDRIGAMARVFHLDPEALQHHRDQWIALVETCAECGSVPTCRAFIAGGGAETEAARGFCPNARAFAAIG